MKTNGYFLGGAPTSTYHVFVCMFVCPKFLFVSPYPNSVCPLVPIRNVPILSPLVPTKNVPPLLSKHVGEHAPPTLHVHDSYYDLSHRNLIFLLIYKNQYIWSTNK